MKESGRYRGASVFSFQVLMAFRTPVLLPRQRPYSCTPALQELPKGGEEGG